ncbi:unnamed protein product [Lactuca virosa]|uniref:Uncharacterized protein n=1 Tax=Lactuca virosa TaxID=75947 RepID=A0AAU9NN80_9ASTR|nr:unnamed protein product [Lactuca virosa]
MMAEVVHYKLHHIVNERHGLFSRRGIADMIFNNFEHIGENLGTLIRAFKASFLPFFDEMSSYLMPIWGKDKTTEERRIVIRMKILVCTDKYYDTYLPFLLQDCIDENPDVHQAAVYGLGV